MPWLPKSKVLVPFDFSDECVDAVEVAIEMADSPTDVSVLHVLPRLIPLEPGVIWGAIDDAERRRHALAALQKRLSAPKFQGVSIEIALGEPAREIAVKAQREGVELIVMPSHNRSAGLRLLLGSTTDRVVHMAHCPVLVLRG